MKVPENCENVVRNRKQKSAQTEVVEKPVKNLTKVTESKETKENDNKKFKEPEKVKLSKSHQKLENESPINDNNSTTNFTIKIEFDPMSIALFTVAIITRFFRLSEPRNIV